MEKIRLIMLLEATGGGTRKYIVDVLERLDQNKFEIEFLYSPLRADVSFFEALPKLKALGVRLTAIPMTRGLTPTSDFKSFFKIWRLINVRQPHIVHCHSSKAGFLGRIAAKLSFSRPKTIFTPHGLSTHVSSKYWILEKIASYFTDVAVAVSKSEYDDFINQRIFDRKVSKLITLGLDCKVEHPTVDIRRMCNLPRNSLVVASVGYLSQVKNPLGLLAVAKAVISINNNIHFVWIGDGELRKEAESFINANGLAKNCHLLGWQACPPSILSTCDIFVQTSQYESFGYVLCEAMLKKLPVIATNIMGARTIVVHERTGYLIPNQDWEKFSEKILHLANNKELRDQLGEQGRQRVIHKFDIEKMISETETLYLNLVNKKKQYRRFLFRKNFS